MTTDAIFQLALMTKAIVSVAAMQLVEGGALSLDSPIGSVLPALANPPVIDGFGDNGGVHSRPAAAPITLRHLLTHTSGLGYSFISAGVDPKAWQRDTIAAIADNPLVGSATCYLGTTARPDHPLLEQNGSPNAYDVGGVGALLRPTVGGRVAHCMARPGRRGLSRGRKPFMLAQALTSAPSALKWSLERNRRMRGCARIEDTNGAAMSPLSSRSRFFEKVERDVRERH